MGKGHQLSKHPM